MRNPAVLFLCVVFLFGCSTPPKPVLTDSAPTQADSSKLMETMRVPERKFDFLSVETCKAPCFLDITSGVTSASEARAIISRSKLLSNCTESRPAPNGISVINCDGIGFILRENAVLGIEIEPLKMTAEDIIQKFGIPDKVNVILSPLPDSPIRSEMMFLFNQSRLQINFVDMEGLPYVISPNTEVRWIIFNDEDGQELVNGSGDGISTGVWKGYGVYEFKTEQ